MLPKLDNHDQTPLYQQIKKIIIEAIEKQTWKTDDKIPTELDLEKHFGVSRTTIRQAITELIDEDYLYRKRGIGTFVADTNQLNTKKGASFVTINTSELIQIHSLSSSRKILSVTKLKADKTIASTLRIHEGDEVIELKRLECGDDIPLSFTTTYINSSYVPHFEEDIEEVRKGLHNYLKACGNPVVSIDYQIKATKVTNTYILENLNLPENSATLLLENISKLKDGSVIEFSHSIINSELISIPASFHYQ